MRLHLRQGSQVAYDDLREWIAALDKAGELKRIKEPVSPHLEITEITDRVSKIGKPGAQPTLKLRPMLRPASQSTR